MYNKIDNKGFAITGMLYTLFILFLMIMLSILATANFKKDILINTTSKLENTYSMDKIDSLDGAIETDSENKKHAAFAGKYVFKTSVVEKKVNCTTYVKKGQVFDFDTVRFIPDDCNDTTRTISFENSASDIPVDKLVLIEVYKIKG